MTDYQYRHRTSTSTHEIYDTWNLSTNNWDHGDDTYYSIKVDKDPSSPTYNTWIDNGSQTPQGIDDNADGSVYLYNTVSDMNNGTPLKYSFVKPTNSSWYTAPSDDDIYTIKKDGAAFATTTSNTVYIRETGTYTAEVKTGDEYVTELSKVVSGSITQKLDYKSTVQKIIPTTDGTVSNDDRYAYVGISGNGLVMVIASTGDDDGGTDKGGFIVYEKVGGVWTFTQQITAVGSGSSTFGLSEEGKAVQLDYTGTRVFIGAHADDHTHNNSGSVYIYRRIAKGNWTLEQRIDGGGASYRYGYNDVNNDGDKLLIGSYGYSSNTGRVWYYTRSGTTWTLQEQLAAPHGGTFGISLGMNSTATRAVIGAYNVHKVYIWNRVNNLNTVGHTIEDEHTAYYGDSDWICQSVSGTVGIYKHIYANGNDVDSGFNTIQYDSSTSTWSDHGTGQPVKFTKNDTDWNNRSSTVTNVQAGDVIRGWKDPTETDQRGQFTHPSGSSTTDIWTQQAKIQTNDPQADDYIGDAVAIDGDTIALGSRHEDDTNTDSGSVYIFKKETGDFNASSQPNTGSVSGSTQSVSYTHLRAHET